MPSNVPPDVSVLKGVRLDANFDAKCQESIAGASQDHRDLYVKSSAETDGEMLGGDARGDKRWRMAWLLFTS